MKKKCSGVSFQWDGDGRSETSGWRPYLSGCSCCLSGSLIGCGQPAAGPGRTGWASRVRRGRRSELFPCSSFPSLRGGSKGQEAAGPSGCPSSCWRCGSLSSCMEEHGTKSFSGVKLETQSRTCVFSIHHPSGCFVSGGETASEKVPL